MAFDLISLGAGRQSTAMTMMAAHGMFPVTPDGAIFCDTGDEPAWVYETVRWLQSLTLPFPVLVTSRGCLSEDMLAGQDMARAPMHVAPEGMAGRQCSRNYKIRPFRRAAREFIGLGPRSHAKPGLIRQWVGISIDEASRMKPQDVAYIENYWPLIDARLSVRDCEAWLREHGYPIPWSSACTYCPLVNDKFRRRVWEFDPDGWKRACEVDAGLRTPENVARFRGELYAHPSRKPLSEIDFEAPGSVQYNLFDNECEGICGV